MDGAAASETSDRDTGEDDRDRDEASDDHEPSPAALRASEVLMVAADVSN